MTNHIVFVSCVGKKSSNRCEARLLYESDWFLKARNLVETMGCPWFILSAEYGLVNPATEIDPYDRTLNTMSKAARIAWSNRVLDQFEKLGLKPAKVTVLAGNRYREFIIPRLRDMGIEILIPMEGLRIGEQLSWLNEKVVSADLVRPIKKNLRPT